MILIRDLK